MVRAGMMGIAESDFRIGAAAHLVTHHERDDARHVGLPGEHQEVGHQLEVFREHFRRAGRAFDLRHVAVALLVGELHAALDVADRFQILVDLAAIGSTELAAQSSHIRRVMASRMLRSSFRSAMRTSGSVVPASPNSRSKIARGRFSIGSGEVSLRHEIVL